MLFDSAGGYIDDIHFQDIEKERINKINKKKENSLLGDNLNAN